MIVSNHLYYFISTFLIITQKLYFIPCFLKIIVLLRTPKTPGAPEGGFKVQFRENEMRKEETENHLSTMQFLQIEGRAFRSSSYHPS